MFSKQLKYLKIITILVISFFLITNFYMIISTKDKILTNKEQNTLKNIDFILVLGAGIKNKRPSPMLEDRLKLSILLYQNKTATKILVSGDHIKDDYDEVNVMKKYLLENNIPEEDIIMDNFGISTYDSLYRAKYIYHAKNILIVTQKYHLYRALYIASSLDINAYGYPANQREYTNQETREIREILARSKDFIKSFVKVSSTYTKNN